MAFAVFDVTSITSLATTEPTGPGALMFYGAKFGQTGYWLKIPRVFPAIGECCTTTPTAGDSWGLYYYIGSTTPTFGGDSLGAVGDAGMCPCYRGPIQVKAFEKGGRWIMIAPDGGDTDSLDANGISNFHANLMAGAFIKRMEFYYRSVAECGKPVQSTL